MMGFPAPPPNDSSDDDNPNPNVNHNVNPNVNENVKVETAPTPVVPFTFAPSKFASTTLAPSAPSAPSGGLCFGMQVKTTQSNLGGLAMGPPTTQAFGGLGMGHNKPAEMGCVFPRPPQVQNMNGNPNVMNGNPNGNDQCVFPIQQVNHTQASNIPRAFGVCGNGGNVGNGNFTFKETKPQHQSLDNNNNNKEVIINLYNQMSMMRNQIEQLTKAIDNMYVIISKIQ